MKHAYLIIAHNEFEVLKKLLHAIDDERNDIYVHFDKKIKSIPYLNIQKSSLYILDNRLDVRWGHVSLITVEYTLLELARHQGEKYAYYHIISGTHLPLFSQDYIHSFFDKVQNKDVLSPMVTSNYEIGLKMRSYNFFMAYFQDSHVINKWLAQFFWKTAIWIQRKLSIKRYANQRFEKASQWCSITNNSVDFLLSEKDKILKKYRFTMCGDEFFVPTELMNSPLRANVCYYDRLLKCDFNRTSPCIYHLEDYKELLDSDCLFARKFSYMDMDIVNKILNHIVSES